MVISICPLSIHNVPLIRLSEPQTVMLYDSTAGKNENRSVIKLTTKQTKKHYRIEAVIWHLRVEYLSNDIFAFLASHAVSVIIVRESISNLTQ